MGKRQRYTQFVRLSDEQLQALIDDPETSTEDRQKAIAEQKFRGSRNAQKRRS